MKMSVKILNEIEAYIKSVKRISNEEIDEFEVDIKEFENDSYNMYGSNKGLNCFIKWKNKFGKEIECNVSEGNTKDVLFNQTVIEGYTAMSKEKVPEVSRGSIFYVFRDKGDAELYCLNNNLALKDCELLIMK